MILHGRVRCCAALLAVLCCANIQEAYGAARAVTYGSAIALVHEGSGHRLYSGKIAWGSGSMGQAVTAQSGADPSPSLWLVRPAALPPATPLDPQQPSGPSPPAVGAGISVGASGGAEGHDSRFVVECVEGGDVWRTGAPVRLRNVLLDSNLQASKQHAFSYSNCGRGCPIAGHLEVSVMRGRPSSWSWQQPTDSWSAQPQLLFHAEGETEDYDAHDEL